MEEDSEYAPMGSTSSRPVEGSIVTMDEPKMKPVPSLKEALSQYTKKKIMRSNQTGSMNSLGS